MKKILITFLIIFLLGIPLIDTVQSKAIDNKTQTAQDAINKAKNAYDESLKTVDQLKNDTGGKLEEARKISQQKFEELKKITKDKTEEIRISVQETSKKVTEIKDKAIDITKSTTTTIINKTGEVANNVKDSILNIKPSDIDPDVIKIKVSVAPVLMLFASLKDAINADVGKFDIKLITNDEYQKSFFNLGIIIFILLVIHELIYVLLGKSNVNEFVFNFFYSFIKVFKYILVLNILLISANLFISSLDGGDFTSVFTNQIQNYISLAEKNSNNNWNSFFIAKVQDLPANIILDNNPLTSFFKSVLTPKGQLYWVALISSYTYLGLAIINWTPMIIVNYVLTVCFLISPIIALLGVNETGRQWQSKYWAVVFDSLIAKVSFHLILWFFRMNVFSDKPELLTIIKTVISFIILPILVLKIRSIFAIDYYPNSENKEVNMNIRSGSSRVINNAVASSSKIIQLVAKK